MIIKKPYAFLIKNFKIIHLVLCLCLFYITSKSTAIYSFFNGFVSTGRYVFRENLASYYVNYYTLGLTILVVVFASILYLVLKWKDKKRAFYIFLCVFYTILFIVFIYIFNVLDMSDLDLIDSRILRVYRDLFLMINLPQYFFVGFSFVRGIGFDIKSFNFKKDLQELDIKVEDSEEVEVVINKNGYKVARSIRRSWREFRYYVLENKFFFITMSSVCVLIISTVLIINARVYNKRYAELDNFSANSIMYNVEKSYITSMDYKGKSINAGKEYVLVEALLKNQVSTEKALDPDTLRLIVDGKYYYPVLTRNMQLLDLGNCYTSHKLEPNGELKLLFVYEIDNGSHESFVFSVFNSVSYIKGEINSDEKNVTLSPESVDTKELKSAVKIKDEINFEDSTLGKTKLTVNSYKIANSFSEKYRYCTTKKCYDGTKIIRPEYIGKGLTSVIKFEMSLSVDEDLFMKKYITTPSNFVQYFGYIKYTVGSSTKLVKLSTISIPELNSKNVFVEVPREVLNANSVILYLVVRNITYVVDLK